MHVIVTHRELPEFRDLCQTMQIQAQPQGQWPVWTQPGVSDQCYEYVVADDSPAATWITISRPHWHSDQWRALTRANANPSLNQ